MRQEETESCIMKLPTDLIIAIFFKLDCKNVLSCRGVCRAWYSLISEPNFSSNYSRYSPFPTLLVTQRDASSVDSFFLVHVAADGEFIRRLIKPKVMRYSRQTCYVRVIGSCNGLVFLVQLMFKGFDETERVYFGNPLLGGCVLLTEFKRVYIDTGPVEYVLGFVPSSNKIKLLRIGFDDYKRLREAQILTFREDDEWRKLKDSLTLVCPLTQGTCFNGAYHWVANDENVDWICTFDFQEEKCGRIPKPPGLLQLSHRMKMTVLNNHLCLIQKRCDYDKMIIWTMKEYGVAESWSKDIMLWS